jgi:hypothetical protein
VRRVARVDENQAEIVKAYTDIGASVTELHRHGEGVPDLLVGWRGVNYLVEVKNPKQDLSHRALTPAQKTWHAHWRGQKAVVFTVYQALALIGVR